MITLHTKFFDTDPNEGLDLDDHDYDEYQFSKYLVLSEYCNAVDEKISLEGTFKLIDNELTFPNIVMLQRLFVETDNLTSLPNLKRVKFLVAYLPILDFGVLEEVDTIIFTDPTNTIVHIKDKLYAITYNGKQIHTLTVNNP